MTDTAGKCWQASRPLTPPDGSGVCISCGRAAWVPVFTPGDLARPFLKRCLTDEDFYTLEVAEIPSVFKPVESKLLTAGVAAVCSVSSAPSGWSLRGARWKLNKRTGFAATPPPAKPVGAPVWRAAHLHGQPEATTRTAQRPSWFLHQDVQVHEISHIFKQNLTKRGTRFFDCCIPSQPPTEPSSGCVCLEPSHLHCAGQGPLKHGCVLGTQQPQAVHSSVHTL